ncbi:hypothetical protein AGDE_15266 [Angomonas deanei]|uniref:Uncharacterized protein n=1 Tax=Angomonas deanei TaxID=59799 RepID=A0A7G2CW91_9TRYP|nr:hypothetical protein AGDE_15266 [Angomonas deanei]CAD2222703.1 hypothetical protein, conserved [Angomonas deanei]|eukprot:EPY19381.1 hypothetical protein AGDE_15266 [Angomonas deanei]
MSKVPKSLNVKFEISDFQLELPKQTFESNGARVAIFVGRKGKDALTRRSKWFTISDPSELPTSTRQLATIDMSASRRASAGGVEETANITEQPSEMVVVKFGALNNVTYDVEMHPINKFDGDWVFNAKLGHPLMVFAKVITKTRPGVVGNAAQSERESNLNDMMNIDQEDMDDDFSGDDEKDLEGDQNDEDDLSVAGMKNMGLTAEQVAALTGEDRTEDQVLVEQLIREVAPIKRRYLAFPKQIDVADIVNTKAKTQEFSDRLKCKSAALLGSVLTFKVTAIVPKDEIEKHEEKAKEKEDKEAKKQREKEEKLLEKERKKREKESKKANKNAEGSYGVDVTNRDTDGGAVAHTDASAPASAETSAKKKSRNPFSLIKEGVTSVFRPEDKTQITPFPLKHKSSPFPFLILLDNFQLRQLRMPAQFYRAVHIRFGNDSNSLETFPILLLDASSPQFVKQEEYVRFDGTNHTREFLDFADSHVFIGHKHIRNVTGFDTITALQDHEKKYFERKKKLEEAAGEPIPDEPPLDSFQCQLLDVGEKFMPFPIEPAKYSANGAQGVPDKYTRIVASLIVPKTLTNVPIIDEEAERKAYIAKLKKEQKEKEKAEKEAAKQREKEAKLAAQNGETADDVAAEDSGDEHSSTGDAEKQDEEKKSEPVEEKKEEEPEEKKDEEEGEEKKDGEEGETFESEGADHVEAGESEEPPKPAEPSASTVNKIIANKTSSFQAPTYILNEEYVPRAGVEYVIKFKTGEEIRFRARRVFLPSINEFGDAAAAFNDITLNQFYDEEDSKAKAKKE